MVYSMKHAHAWRLAVATCVAWVLWSAGHSAHAQTWTAIKDKQVIPILKVKGTSPDLTTVCTKLKHDPKHCTDKVKRFPDGLIHWITVDVRTDEQRRDYEHEHLVIYVGVMHQGASAIRYWRLGRHDFYDQSGTSVIFSSDLMPGAIRAMTIADQPAVAVDLNYTASEADRIGVEDAFDICTDLVTKEDGIKPDDDRFDSAVQVCIESERVGPPSYSEDVERYRYVFVGVKPRLVAVYKPVDAHFSIRDQRVTERTSLRFDALGWCLHTKGKDKPVCGSLTKGPALVHRDPPTSDHEISVGLSSIP